MSQTHIVIAIPCLNRGGTEMQTLNMLKTLSDTTCRVSILCYFENSNEVVTEFQETGSNVVCLNLNRSTKPYQLVEKLLFALKKLNPDIVHVQYMSPGAIPIIAARLAGIRKVLATVHQPYTAGHGWKAKFILRFSSIFCTRFICVSQNAEISWFGSGSLYDENISLSNQPKHFTIYNAVDTAKILLIEEDTDVEKEKNKLGIRTDSFLIGAISRLTYEKGIDILIDAFALATQHYSDIHLLIVGTGTEEATLKQLVQNKGIDNLCTFFGNANWDVAMQQMALMDVVVVPSRFEGFGLTAAEAAAMAKPVIASNVYGLKEVINTNVSGVLFDKENSVALKDIILTMKLNKNNILKDLGDNAKSKANREFSLEVLKRKINGLYRDIING